MSNTTSLHPGDRASDLDNRLIDMLEKIRHTVYCLLTSDQPTPPAADHLSFGLQTLDKLTIATWRLTERERLRAETQRLQAETEKIRAETEKIKAGKS